MKKQRPVLSISMLASDRLDTLPRCLDSLTPIREAFPCELIIVDTSKNPAVHELISRYADKVDTFEWCDDFAKARNVGVAMAEGEWFMFIDDDEWFAEPEELIEFFRSGEYKQYGYAHHRIKNFHDPEFKTYGYGWVSRLTKINTDTAFHSKIHEYLKPLEGVPKTLHATSYHTGYMYKTPEELKAHFDRNIRLLEKMEQEEPEVLRWKVQILQEYVTIRDWKNMAIYAEKALKYLWGTPRVVDAPAFATMHIGYAIALYETEQYELVEDVYRKAQDVVKNTVLAKAYMELCMAQSFWAMKEYEKAKHHALQYLEGYKAYCEDVAAYDTEIIKLFLKDTFDDNRITKAYSIILAKELKDGNEDVLYELYPKLMWDKEFINGYCEVEVEILDCLIRRQDYTMLKRVLQEALSTQFIRPRMMKAILDWEVKDEAEFRRLLDVVKKLDVQSWYKEYAILLTLEETATREEVLEIAKRLINLIPNIFAVPSEIEDVLKQYDIKVADLFLHLEFTKWRDALNEHFQILKMEQVVELKDVLEDSDLAEDVRFYYFMMVYMEQKALLAGKDKLSFDELTDILAKFSDYTCLCYEDMYGEQLEAMNVEQWPEKYQAAKWLQIFFAEVGNDIKSALGCLAKVIGIYPRFADTMKYYLERIQIEILNG